MRCDSPGCFARAHRGRYCDGHRALQAELAQFTGRNPSERRSLPHLRPTICDCAQPVPGVIQLFGWGSRVYIDREPRPGDPVQCRQCGMPIADYLWKGDDHEAVGTDRA